MTHHGTITGSSESVIWDFVSGLSPRDGDTLIVWRPVYGRFEALVWDRAMPRGGGWIYIGQGTEAACEARLLAEGYDL